MRKIPIKTLWSGKAWVHQKYLREAQANKKGIILVYRGKEMTIPSIRINIKYWTKGSQEHADLHNGEPYYLWGIPFLSDEKVLKKLDLWQK